jgi:hypothetical protein
VFLRDTNKVDSKLIFCDANKSENKLIWRHSVVQVLSGLYPRLLSNSKKNEQEIFKYKRRLNVEDICHYHDVTEINVTFLSEIVLFAPVTLCLKTNIHILYEVQ